MSKRKIKNWRLQEKISLSRRRNLTSVRNACKETPRSLFCAPNRLKSWNTDEGPDQRFWPCFAAGLNHSLVSSVVQAIEKIRNDDPKFTVKHFHCHSKWHGLLGCRLPKGTYWGHHWKPTWNCSCLLYGSFIHFTKSTLSELLLKRHQVTIHFPMINY